MSFPAITSPATESAAAASAPSPPTTLPFPQVMNAMPWPLLCPTPDCNEHLRAHPHPSAPVLFAACGHSHCGLCAAVVLREPLPQCPTCGVGVGVGQASPNTGLGDYGEVIVNGCIHTAASDSATNHAVVSDGLVSAPALHLCTVCQVCDGVDETATFICSCGSCDNQPLCCDHSRFHAKKTGHKPVCVEGDSAETAARTGTYSVRCECAVHDLPITHYCMLHTELLCDSCVATLHLSCASAHVKPVQVAADNITPALLDVVASFTSSANGMLIAITTITAAKSNMSSRLQASISRFSDSIDVVIDALHVHRARVITAANLQCTEYTKALDSQAEVLSVSASQLQAAVALAARAISSCSPVRILEAHATVKSMAALVKQYDGPVVVPVVEVRCDSHRLLDKLGDLYKVVTGCGLKAVSVSGLVLQPGPRQDLRVVLSLNDGSSPSWLIDSDLKCTVQGMPVGITRSSTSTSGGRAGGCAPDLIKARVLSQCVGRDGGLLIEYELMCSDVQEVVLRVSVIGVNVSPCCGWRAYRKQTTLSCMAVGTHIRTLSVVIGHRACLAVSADEQWLVVGLWGEGTLSVYSLPDGKHVRKFRMCYRGFYGSPCYRLCFAPNGNLFVVISHNLSAMVNEVTLTGEFVRRVGEDVWSGAAGEPRCVAVRKDVIAVGAFDGTGPRVTLLGLDSGAVIAQFGEVGTAPGQLSRTCSGIRFSADGRHLVLAESEAKRVSVFTVGGVFVRCVGVGFLSGTNKDVCVSAKGELIVADTENHRVCLFAADGSTLVRTWGSYGSSNGKFKSPTALAIVGAYLYVMDNHSPRVQVFQ